MVGPVVGSAAAHFGRAAPGLIAALLCLTNVFFAWRWLPESRKEQSGPARPRRPLWHPAWSVVRHPFEPVARFIWIYAVGMLAFSSMTSVVALYLGAEFAIDEKTIGYVFLYIGVLSFVMRSLLLGPIVDRIGESWAMRIGTLLLIAGLLIYPLPRSLGLLAVVIPLVPIGTALLFPATTSLMSRQSDPAELGTTMGVAQTFAGLARVAAPLLATTAFQRLGHGWPFYIAGGYVALVGLMAFRMPTVRRMAAEPRTEEGARAL
jgi:predicted MFS family arabinose efflux permease